MPATPVCPEALPVCRRRAEGCKRGRHPRSHGLVCPREWLATLLWLRL